MTRFRIAFGLLVLGAVVLFLESRSIRIHTASRGDEVVFRFARPTLLISIMAAILPLAAAYLMFASRVGLLRLFGFLPAFMGLMLVFVAYQVATDRVVIGQSSLLVPEAGFPLRSHSRFAYEELSGVVCQKAADAKGRDLEFIRRDGRKTSIPVGDLVQQALPQIVKALDLHAVPYGDIQ
jgi:hypothetical protein